MDQLSIQYIFNGPESIREVALVQRGLADIQDEDVRGGHVRAVHVLVARHEVHRAVPQLSPLFVVLPQPHVIERRVVTVVRGIEVTAEVADPLQPVLYEAKEGVNL